MVPNTGPIAASFPFPFLAAFLQALTLALATLAISSNAGIGAVSDGGRDDTTEAKAAATGSLPSRRWRFAYIKPGISAPGQAPSILFPPPLLLCALHEGQVLEG